MGRPGWREWRVAAGEDGQRIDVLVARWLEEPRARAQQRLAAGEVTIDGVPIAKSHRARLGERVGVTAPPPTPPRPPPPRVVVRWEDDHLAVVVKPAGLVVHAGSGHHDVTLVDALRAAGMPLASSGDPDRPGIVHRLDRGTSGVLVVAKSPQGYAGLVPIFKAHEIERRYWTLLDGVPDPPSATLDAPSARSRAVRTRFRVDAEGRPAVTHYDTRESFGFVTILDVQLETGRTHQVRVHLAAIGHPVTGDEAYGASPVIARQLGLRRPALHARQLGFRHPVTGQRVEVDEPLPADLESAVAWLRRGHTGYDRPIPKAGSGGFSAGRSG